MSIINDGQAVILVVSCSCSRNSNCNKNNRRLFIHRSKLRSNLWGLNRATNGHTTKLPDFSIQFSWPPPKIVANAFHVRCMQSAFFCCSQQRIMYNEISYFAKKWIN